LLVHHPNEVDAVAVGQSHINQRHGERLRGQQRVGGLETAGKPYGVVAITQCGQDRA
jgi:hypothetical protein